ncbi:MAG: serine/threonine-protein kinase [Gemmatimonadota bacterium]
MTEPGQPTQKFDAVTTPAGITTICPQCGASLDALIGRGGMGIVFKAREVTLEREVALKVLAFDPMLNPEAFVRFEREARLAARLDHPNIVPIFAVGKGEGIAFYTMRFVRGGSLEGLLADKGALPLDHAVRLLRDVASALDFAHAQGVVHRDIKPANILISDSGHAMVADYGIARAFGGDETTSTSGSHTGVVGSPAYMAPEQWRGERPDGRADQYALGVLAFELLAGRRPFADVSMQELLRMHLGEEPPALKSVRKGLPPNVSLAIQRAMAKEPADRFPNSMAFIDALAGDAAVGAVRTIRRPATATATAAGAGTPRWVWYAAAVLLAAAAWPLYQFRQRTLEQARVAAAVAVPAPASADTLSERLSRELEETRRIVIDAQRRAERAEAMQRNEANVPKSVAAASSPVGHVGVMVRGGAPRLIIDDAEVAASTPAILSVPVGRHVVRVAEAGRQYLPAQYVIDVVAGDTSRLQFSDPRLANREFQPLQQQLQQRSARPNRAGDSAAARVFGVTSQHPYLIGERAWVSMSPQEQALVQARWDRLSPDQQRRLMRDIRLRDSTRFKPPLPPRP